MNRMRELRLEKGISMREAAERLNMPYTTYVNYEKNTREPNSETLIDIANFYNTSIDYLLGRSNERIDDRILDIVNTIDDDILQNTGNLRDAISIQAKRDATQSAKFSDTDEELLFSNYKSLNAEKKRSLIDYSNYLKSQM